MNSKHTLRSARPTTAYPDRVFVDQLGQRLQARAEVLASAATVAKKPKSQPWFMLGTVSFGAVLAVVAIIAFIPRIVVPTRTVSGYIQKGPFITGSSITIQELDHQLQPTGKNYQVTTSSDFGDYTLSQKMRSPYVEVIASGYYYDEVQGKLSVAPLTLRAIAEVKDHQAVNVNVLTSLAGPRLRYLVTHNQVTFAVAKQQAEQEVLNIFQITATEVDDFETLTISKSGNSNGALLASSVLVQGQQSVAQVSELLSKLSLDLQTDGTVLAASPLFTTIKKNAAQLSVYDIETHLQQRFTALGIKGAVPEFEQFLQPFVSTADPFAYRVTLLHNIFGVNHTPGATIKVTLYSDYFEKNQEEVSIKNLFQAKQIVYVDDRTIVAEFPINTLSAGSYTVMVRNRTTDRIGVTDGEPLETQSNIVAEQRLILQGETPVITRVSPAVSYLDGGTIVIHGKHFAYGTFVWINNWQVPQDAIRVANGNLIKVDLSPALIANNVALPRNQTLSVVVQTPDFQKAEYSGFEIQ